MSEWSLRIIGAVFVLLLFGRPGGVVESRAQPDSVRAEILKSKGFSPDHSPWGALWRGAVAPGWGQLYNRQYYKIPFVYAGFAGLGLRIYRSHQHYRLFQRAHLYGRGESMAEEGEENPYRQYESQYNQVAEFVGERVREMRNQRDRFRRRRDLTILGTGVFYALTLLDAYVSAHLLTFDVDETLSIRVHPIGPVGRAPAGRGGASRVRQVPPSVSIERSVGMRVQLRF